MKYVKIIFIIVFINLIFTGCMTKFFSLAETGNIKNLEKACVDAQKKMNKASDLLNNKCELQSFIAGDENNEFG